MRGGTTSLDRLQALFSLDFSGNLAGSLWVLFVLSRVCHFVFENLDELVEQYRSHCAGTGTDPCYRRLVPGFTRKPPRELTVYPVLSIKCTSDDAWTETTSWVQAAPSVVHADELSDEESKANANRRNECGFMLLLGEPCSVLAFWATETWAALT